MKLNRKWTILLVAGILAGCGGVPSGNNSTGESVSGGAAASSPTPAANTPESFKPVTLKMYQIQSLWTQDDFDMLIADPVKEKYPHITIEFVTDGNVQNALTAGEDMDLIAVWNGNMPYYMDFEVFEDITPLAEQMNFDLSRFDEGALDSIRALSESGELVGLPNMLQFNALYYNKDIFDLFGVPYPQDGMTWDQTIELAREVTRTEDGVSYLGLDPDYLTRMLTPMSLNIVDGNTDKANVNNDEYRKVFEMAKGIYDIEGNKPEAIMQGSATDRFIVDRNVAMLTTVNILGRLRAAPDLNWDVAQFPSYAERPDMYGMYDLHVMTVSKTSKHKEDAMRVLEVLFSDEVQLKSARIAGKLPVLKDPKFNEAYLEEASELQDKQIQSIFKSSPAPAPAYSQFYSKGRGILVRHFVEYANNQKDVNTALREAEAEINQMIEAEQ